MKPNMIGSKKTHISFLRAQVILKMGLFCILWGAWGGKVLCPSVVSLPSSSIHQKQNSRSSKANSEIGKPQYIFFYFSDPPPPFPLRYFKPKLLNTSYISLRYLKFVIKLDTLETIYLVQIGHRCSTLKLIQLCSC